MRIADAALRAWRVWLSSLYGPREVSEIVDVGEVWEPVIAPRIRSNTAHADPVLGRIIAAERIGDIGETVHLYVCAQPRRCRCILLGRALSIPDTDIADRMGLSCSRVRELAGSAKRELASTIIADIWGRERAMLLAMAGARRWRR